MFVQAIDGAGAFAGSRYASRLGDELTNWAILEPNEPTHIRTYDLTLIDD